MFIRSLLSCVIYLDPHSHFNRVINHQRSHKFKYIFLTNVMFTRKMIQFFACKRYSTRARDSNKLSQFIGKARLSRAEKSEVKNVYCYA